MLHSEEKYIPCEVLLLTFWMLSHLGCGQMSASASHFSRSEQSVLLIHFKQNPINLNAFDRSVLISLIYLKQNTLRSHFTLYQSTCCCLQVSLVMEHFPICSHSVYWRIISGDDPISLRSYFTWVLRTSESKSLSKMLLMFVMTFFSAVITGTEKSVKYLRVLYP